MPNRPEDPYGRFPPGAAIGLLFMIAGGAALLFLSATWQDWRQAILGALILGGMIGATLLLRRVRLPPFRFRRRPVSVMPPPADDPIPLRGFDPAGFIQAARHGRTATPPRIESKPGRDSAAEQQAKEEGTIRRLQDLRDHPATPEPERQAAEAKLKKARAKRRSAWKERP